MTSTNDISPILIQLGQTFTQVPFNRLLGLHLDHIDPQHVIMSFNMQEDLIGNFLKGILHGGVISSVFDMAGGLLAMSTTIINHANLSQDEMIERIGKTSTIDLQISYLRPGRGTRFTAQAWILKAGKNICFTRMEFSNENEILIATGSGTYLLK